MAVITSRTVIDETNIAIPTHQTTLTIANGSDTSDVLRLAGDAVIGVITPPTTFEPTGLTVEVSIDGTVWSQLFDNAANAIAIVTAPGEAYQIPPTTIYGWTFVRFVGDMAASGANRNIIILIKKV